MAGCICEWAPNLKKTKEKEAEAEDDDDDDDEEKRRIKVDGVIKCQMHATQANKLRDSIDIFVLSFFLSISFFFFFRLRNVVRQSHGALVLMQMREQAHLLLRRHTLRDLCGEGTKREREREREREKKK